MLPLPPLITPVEHPLLWTLRCCVHLRLVGPSALAVGLVRLWAAAGASGSNDNDDDDDDNDDDEKAAQGRDQAKEKESQSCLWAVFMPVPTYSPYQESII